MASLPGKEWTSEDLQQLLNSTPSVKADYNLLLIKLKRRLDRLNEKNVCYLIK